MVAGAGAFGVHSRAMIPFLSETGRRKDEFLLALRFLTRLPLGAGPPAVPGALAQAGWAFPLVGLGVGVLVAIAYAVARLLALPPLLAALAAVGAGILLTGALHEDGLADSTDGLGGGQEKAEKLAIMRDSRIGTFGVVALILSIAFRATALSMIWGRWEILAALVAAHAVGRGALPVVLALLPPARQDGLGVEAGRTEPVMAAVSAGIAILVALVALGPRLGLEALLAAAVVMALAAFYIRRQIGGQTGDVLGAIEQMGETVMLLAVVAWG